LYRDHRKVSGGPPGGADLPGRPNGLYMGGNQPPSGLVRPPKGPWRLGLGNPRGGSLPPCLGGKFPSPGRLPSPQIGSEGAGPLSSSPINSGGVGGRPHPSPWRSPSPLQHLLLLPRCLAKPCRNTTQLQLHHAVVLLLELSSPTSPPPLLDQEGGDVPRLHMC
jgi:hypothetical protein